MLKAADIEAHHCFVVCSEGKVCLQPADGRCIVNGEEIATSVKLTHGMKSADSANIASYIGYHIIIRGFELEF